MELARRAEGQAALIRWAALLVAAVMLTDALPFGVIARGLAFVALYNAALTVAARLPEQYASWGRRLGAAANLLDVAAISVAVAATRHSVPNLYLLFTLAILVTGHVARSGRRIGAVTGLSVAGNLIATALSMRHGSLRAVFSAAQGPSVAIIASGAVAASLHLFKQRDDTLQRRNSKLAALLEFGTRFATGEEAARVMEQTLRAAIRETDATAGYIMLLNDERTELLTEVSIGVGVEHPFPETRRLGEGIEGYVAETGRPLVLSRDADRKGPSAEVSTSFRYDGSAVMSIPMVETRGGSNVEQKIGVFTLVNHRAGTRFLDDDVDLVRTLASFASMAIVNSRLYEEQRTSFLRSLQALARTLEAKDPYTQGHAFRVSEVCVRIAQKLKVTPEVIEDLRNGALLHDIGKIGIPDAVLRKPDRLTDEEFEIMKQHPVIGYEICKPLGLGDGILMLIRNHHEKLDGKGYPDGLKLGELPLPLRIICAADAFDAMSSSRPYRKVMDSHVRNEQLMRFAGTQFDPIVIEILKGLVSNGELNELYKHYWEKPAEGDIQLSVSPEPVAVSTPALVAEFGEDVVLFKAPEEGEEGPVRVPLTELPKAA